MSGRGEGGARDQGSTTEVQENTLQCKMQTGVQLDARWCHLGLASHPVARKGHGPLAYPAACAETRPSRAPDRLEMLQGDEGVE